MSITPVHPRLLILLLVLAVVTSAGMPAFAQTVFEVNTRGNQSDISPGDGLCRTSLANLNCSLRAAIEEANAFPNAGGADIIQFTNIPLANGRAIIDISGSDLPDITAPVTIDGTTAGGEVVIDGYTEVPLDQRTIGLTLATGSHGSTIRGLTITRFVHGIAVESNDNTILENYVGLYQDGSDFGNSDSAIYVSGNGNKIGKAGEGNVLGHNLGSGIEIAGGAGNFVRGNYIGTNEAGDNLRNGIVGNPFGVPQGGIVVSGDDNIVGGTSRDMGNIIGFHFSGGVELNGDRNVVRNNYIGTNAAGMDLGNTNGIEISGTENTVGGTAAYGNIVAFSGYGIMVFGPQNTIQGNYVGTNEAGNDLGNSLTGIIFWSPASDSNKVGYGKNAEIPLSAPKANIIAYNGAGGVVVLSWAAAANTIRGNVFFENKDVITSDSLGINLGFFDGITLNDAGDADTGANMLMNYPDVSRAFYRPGSDALIIDYSVSSDSAVVPYPLTIDAYLVDSATDRQAKSFIGTHSYTSPDSLVSFEIDANSVAWDSTLYVVLTATDADGNTSEFSAPAGPLGTGPGSFLTTQHAGPADAPAPALPASPRETLSLFPNPFNTQATVVLTPPESGRVRVTVHDALGRQVAVLQDGEVSAGTTSTFVLDGAHLASGVYLLRVQGGGFGETRRITLMK
ncbi:MAG: T9SS type A sorting domain-containing protein [Rhodothermales bacterium]